MLGLPQTDKRAKKLNRFFYGCNSMGASVYLDSLTMSEKGD